MSWLRDAVLRALVWWPEGRSLTRERALASVLLDLSLTLLWHGLRAR